MGSLVEMSPWRGTLLPQNMYSLVPFKVSYVNVIIQYIVIKIKVTQ